MPRSRPMVCSFWVYRPVEHPTAFDYPVLLRILQTSCDRLGLRHVVLTDHATLASERWPAGIEGLASDLPLPLMQAATTAHANLLEAMPANDVLFVGADCILLRDPSSHVPSDVALSLTYRHADARYPINNGFMYVHRSAMAHTSALFRRVADRCGAVWCDDQRALIAELSPMPASCGIYERAGMRVCFLPMMPFNNMPRTVDAPAGSAVAFHFRGKQHATGQHRKELMVAWAQRHGFA